LCMTRVIRGCITCILAVVFCFVPLQARGMDYIDFLMKAEVNGSYEKDLLQKAGDIPLGERWAVLSSNETDEVKASQSFALMVELLEGRSLSEIDDISGFINEITFLSYLSIPPDQGISKQLIIFQSAMASFASLCRIKEPASLGLARDILLSIDRTYLIRDLVGLLKTEEYKSLYDTFSTTRRIYEDVYQGSFT